MKSVIFRCVTVLLLVTSLSACETMEGAGRDIQKAGEAIEGAAE